jgi:hypothetical protein
LRDTAIGVDATHYLQLFLDNPPYHEPLLPALGGLTGIESHIEGDLDNWKANNTTPLFVFNGQSVVGQDDVFGQRAKRAVAKTDDAWDLYFRSQANAAVTAFGSNRGAYPVQNLFPLLQGILMKRNIHFIVPPFNASAQVRVRKDSPPLPSTFKPFRLTSRDSWRIWIWLNPIRFLR